MRTVDDYMDDSRIDPSEPYPLRRIHAIRLQNYDETKGLSSSEYVTRINNKAKAYLLEHGMADRLVTSALIQDEMEDVESGYNHQIVSTL